MDGPCQVHLSRRIAAAVIQADVCLKAGLLPLVLRYEEYIPLKKRRAMEERTRLAALGKVQHSLLTNSRLTVAMNDRL
jgi:hypothetical protein